MHPAAGAPVTGALVTGVVAASVARAVWAQRARVPGGAGTWERTNHAGRPVSLLEGPAWTAGVTLGVLAAPGLPTPVRWGAVLATAGAGVFGAVDDLTGSSADKGLRGHLGALARGRLTTGGLKVLGIGLTSLVAAWPLLAGDRAVRWPASRSATRASGLADGAVAAALVAGSANLGNLLDLRPGRVLKIALAAACVPGPPVARLLTAAAGGSALAVLPADLGERAMLGDCGANAAGALLGSALVAGTAGTTGGRATRAVALAVVVALTLASEKVSFTRVIEATPLLRGLDAAGRRPRPEDR